MKSTFSIHTTQHLLHPYSQSLPHATSKTKSPTFSSTYTLKSSYLRLISINHPYVNRLITLLTLYPLQISHSYCILISPTLKTLRASIQLLFTFTPSISSHKLVRYRPQPSLHQPSLPRLIHSTHPSPFTPLSYHHYRHYILTVSLHSGHDNLLR
jgi:hypothetical protein